MELVIKNNEKNDMLSRVEVSGVVSFDKATPNRSDVKKEVCKSLKVNEDLVVVKNILTSFGDKTASFSVFVYDNKDKLSLFEQKYMVKRNFPEKKEEKAEDKPAEEKPAEAPADAAPVEKPAETPGGKTS